MKKIISTMLCLCLMCCTFVIDVSAASEQKLSLNAKSIVFKSTSAEISKDIVVKVTNDTSDTEITATTQNMGVAYAGFTKKDSQGYHFNLIPVGDGGATSIIFTNGHSSIALPVVAYDSVNFKEATNKNSVFDVRNIRDIIGSPENFKFTKAVTGVIHANWLAPNYTKKDIKTCTLKLSFYDSVGNKLYNDYSGEDYASIKLKDIDRDEKFLMSDNVFVSKDCANVVIDTIKIEYTNGTTDYGLYCYGVNDLVSAGTVVVPQTNDTVAYYSKYPTVPDFGKFANAKLSNNYSTSKATFYAYKGGFDIDKIEEYTDMLIAKGFSYMGSFENQSGNDMLAFDNGKISVVVGVEGKEFLIMVSPD